MAVLELISIHEEQQVSYQKNVTDSNWIMCRFMPVAQTLLQVRKHLENTIVAECVCVCVCENIAGRSVLLENLNRCLSMFLIR